MRHARPLTFSLALAASAACHAPSAHDAHAADAPRKAAGPALTPPLPFVATADELIAPGEKHFAHLWRLTNDVDNAAEAYWNFAGDALTLQAQGRGVPCDAIFTLAQATGPKLHPLSNGQGVTTCSYFLPDGKSVLYASTHAAHRDCPPKPDMSRGYVWAVYPEYDIYVHDLASGKEHALTHTWGYDAEASVSPLGDRIVFTSTRSGDLELWTCALDGTDLRQVTDAPGYDGGAFFSHDGKWLVFRSTVFTPGKEAEEIAKHQATLRDWKVRPSRMEIMLVRPDGSERRQVTKLGGANFAPFFYPDDSRIIFSTNHQDKSREARKFDLFACGLDGEALEQITTYEGFDCFPMFSPDGKWLVFASNRGGSTAEETNLYLAQWR